MPKNKWMTDQAYIDLLGLFRNNLSDDELGLTKDNYHNFNKSYVEKLNDTYLDLSGIDLSFNQFGHSWLVDMFMYQSNFSFCHFKRTLFQDSFAKEANFSHSHFERAQAVPFYAPKANFENCIFDHFLTFAFGNDRKVYKNSCDFRECNFKNTQIYGSQFEHVYFSKSNFTLSVIENTKFRICTFDEVDFEHALLKECTFKSFIAESPEHESPRDRIIDFRGAKFKNTRFENCTFDKVFFDDDPEIKQMILSGNNINTEAIVWVAKDADAKK